MAILRQPEQEMMPHLARRHHGFVDIAAAVAHVDPTTLGWGFARGADPFQPPRRFPRPLLALIGAFAGRGRLAHVQLLIRQAQHLPRLRHHGQTVVLQEATSVAIANRTALRRVHSIVSHVGLGKPAVFNRGIESDPWNIQRLCQTWSWSEIDLVEPAGVQAL